MDSNFRTESGGDESNARLTTLASEIYHLLYDPSARAKFICPNLGNMFLPRVNKRKGGSVPA